MCVCVCVCVSFAQARFILAVVNDELVLRNKKKSAILARLISDGYDPIPKGSTNDKKSTADDEVSVLPS